MAAEASVPPRSAPFAPPTLSLYLHTPFCQRKCPYCDFGSQAFARIPEAAYAAAVGRELEVWRETLRDSRPLSSIFFGGGTPSLLAPETVAGWLDLIRRLWPLQPGCEITLEANPESATWDRLAGYRAAGVNRLSLGAQSLDKARLAGLERPHDVVGILRAVEAARRGGFSSIGLDLIYATPGQRWKGWRRELEAALALEPDHLSCYQLTVEEGTPLAARQGRGTFTPLKPGRQAQLFQRTRAWLARRGFPPYEISNFAPPGRERRHNDLIWRYGDYLGVGAAAHGKWTVCGGARVEIRRSANHRRVEDYLQAMARGEPPGERWRVAPEEAAAECVILGLRRAAGMDRAEYARWVGGDLLSRRGEEARRLREVGWLEWNEARIWIPEAGMVRADGIIARLA
ncbi:MAG: radical SAM family heme chaperone HemW [Magnetococcales bacterium]|nr:radical SAM family heme chaperone HemW [Magnetococcales bacterium]